MIAPSNPEPDAQGEGDGLSPTQQNLLIKKALFPRNKFKLKGSAIKTAVDETVKNMRSDSGRVSNGAVSNFIKMMQHNLDVDRPRSGNQVNVQVNIESREDRNARLDAVAAELGLSGLVAGPSGVGSSGHPAAIEGPPKPRRTPRSGQG